MTDDTSCPICEATERETWPGEFGYGTHVSCADCGYQLAYTEGDQ